MRISMRSRRVFGLAACIITLIAVAIWSLVGEHFLYRFALEHLAQSVPLSKAGGPRPDGWDQAAFRYYWLCIGALVLATGFSVALLVLIPRPAFRQRAWMYLSFLAVLLPATMYNYGQGDVVLRAPVQFCLNLLLIFLASTTWLWLNKAPATVADTVVLKHLSLGLILLGGVLIPAIFSVVWAFFAVGLLSKLQTKEITFAHITGLASILSVVIAWLNYKKDPKKIEADLPVIAIAKR